MKPFDRPEALRLMAPRASAYKSLGAMIMNRARVGIKNDMANKISKVCNRKKIYDKTGT